METALTKNSRLFRNPNLSIGIILALFLACITFLGGVLVPHDPFQIDMNNRLQGVSSGNLLGTDQLGRDVFSRIIYGAKLTIGLGMFAIMMSICIGVPIGLLSGYIGGKIDPYL